MHNNNVSDFSSLYFPNSSFSERNKTHKLSLLNTLSSDIVQDSQLQNCPVWVIADSVNAEQAVALHSHNGWEISLCQSGSADYLIKNSRYSVSPSDIIVIPPQISHRLIGVTSTEPFKRVILCLNTEFAQSLADLSAPYQGHVFSMSSLENQEHIRELFDFALSEAVTKPDRWESMITAISVQLFLLLFRIRENERNTVVQKEADLLDQVLHYMSVHLNAVTSSRDIASHFHISDSHLRSLFKQRYGISIHKFMMQLKLALAKNLVIEGKSMNEICESIGFRDYSSFYKAFKHQFGISPSAYKKMQSD